MAFPKTQALNYYRGDTFEFKVELYNQDGTEFELTHYEGLTFKIANIRGSGATQYVGVAAKEDPNIVKCTILPSVGRGLSAGDYVYDVQITDTTPDPDIIYTVLTGTLTVTDDVSGAV